MKEKLLSLKLPGGTQITPPDQFITTPANGLNITINWIITLLGIVAAVAALFFLIWGGIRWITASGDKEKLQKARATIMYSIIGLLIVIFSILIITIIGGVLGVSPLKTTGFTCPDGSNNYACGKTSDTECPLCSPMKDCSTGLYSIAQCSSGPGCTKDSDCPQSSCPLGQKSASYCGPAGFCKTHCIPDDFPIQE